MGSPLGLHFYAIMKKNGWIIAQTTLRLWYTKVQFMIFFFFFLSKEHLQLFVDHMNKQHKCIKITSETEHDSSFSFLDLDVTRQNQQFETSV